MQQVIDASNKKYLDELKAEDIYIKDFRKLKAYQLSMGLAVNCIKIADSLPSYEKYVIADQIRRASTGVVAQIAEGNGQFYKKRELQFISTAIGSLCETECWITLCYRCNYIKREKLDELEGLAVEIKSLLVTYIRHLLK